jgi:chromate transporter
MILYELFWAWFQIGLFSIGGGYAALPIIKNMIVDNYGWLSVAQFADLVVIDEMAPGPIILNSATFVGAQVAGFPGAVMATLGCLTGPAIIVSIIAYFYFKYKELPVIKIILNVIRPAVVALIASAGLTIIILTLWGDSGFSVGAKTDFIAAGLAVAAFALMRKFKIVPELVMLGCGVVGGVIYYFI